jgi:hypothetical protein
VFFAYSLLQYSTYSIIISDPQFLILQQNFTSFYCITGVIVGEVPGSCSVVVVSGAIVVMAEDSGTVGQFPSYSSLAMTSSMATQPSPVDLCMKQTF